MSALDDYSISELDRLHAKYAYDTTGFRRQVEQAIKHKQLDAMKVTL